MNQSLPLASKLQLRLMSRLAWPALFLLTGVPALFRFAATGAVSELLTGAGFVLFSISAFFAPLTPEWRMSARLTQEAAIGPRKLHRVVEIVCLLSVAVGLGMRVFNVLQTM
ncbi:hypothetical protein [Massilia cavernae]|nr:hypothetical protein [Massilia cavernae]